MDPSREHPGRAFRDSQGEPGPVPRRAPGEPEGRRVGAVLVVVLALSVLPFALIYKQDALGSAMVLAVVMIGMLLMAGTKGRHMIVLALLAAVAIGGILQLGVLKQYQKDRLLYVLGGAERGRQLDQRHQPLREHRVPAGRVQSGDRRRGFGRKGPVQGDRDQLVLRAQPVDRLHLTAVAEQFGFAGSALLLALFVLMIWRSWRAAVLSRDLAGTLICVGVLSMLTFQVFENIGMTMGIMPVAGITLPFMSAGGSSMVIDWIAVGLVANVSMRRLS